MSILTSYLKLMFTENGPQERRRVNLGAEIGKMAIETGGVPCINYPKWVPREMFTL